MTTGTLLDSQPEDGFDPIEFTHFDTWYEDEDGNEEDNSLEIQKALLSSFEKLTGVTFQHIREKNYIHNEDFLEDCTPLLLAAGYNVYSSDTCYEVYGGRDTLQILNNAEELAACRQEIDVIADIETLLAAAWHRHQKLQVKKGYSEEVNKDAFIDMCKDALNTVALEIDTAALAELKPNETAAEWVVFRSRDTNNDEATYVDDYSIYETEADAKSAYSAMLTHESTYCAGYAQIKAGTEPHWTEGEE